MALESDLQAVLSAIVPRVYPDLAPEPLPARPYVVYQQVGGGVINPLSVTSQADIPDLRHARIQVAVWDAARLSAGATSRLIEDAMRLATSIRCEPIGAAVSDHDPATGLYGARQDFSVWYR